MHIVLMEVTSVVGTGNVYLCSQCDMMAGNVPAATPPGTLMLAVVH